MYTYVLQCEEKRLRNRLREEKDMCVCGDKRELGGRVFWGGRRGGGGEGHVRRIICSNGIAGMMENELIVKAKGVMGNARNVY